MHFPRGPRAPSLFDGRSPTDGKVLGVGWRVVVTCPDGGPRRVTLTDDGGTKAVATLAGGIEVEILAWRPRRGGETRYRVVPTTGGAEGWVGATSLRPRTTTPPAPRIAGAPAPHAPSRARGTAAARARSKTAAGKRPTRGAARVGRGAPEEIR